MRHCGMGSFAADFRQFTGADAPEGLSPQLEHYWDLKVSELATLHEPGPGPEDQERHRIFALMLMGLVHEYWNGNKNGRAGRYPWNEENLSVGPHLDEDYKGHNIAAIAVNSDGIILDFDFNHNRLFNSSAEHAEARLVRRIFGLAQLADTWRPAVDGQCLPHSALSDYTTLPDITIYTSLESCAQCAGVMALGRVRQVVYLQTDPGMYFIGRILRNLTDENLRAPLPISGGEIGLPYFAELDAAAGAFARQVPNEPFWIEHQPNGAVRRDTSQSVTSFLCTKNARDIYGDGRERFKELLDGRRELEFPEYRPTNADGTRSKTVRSNQEVVTEAADFLAYAITSGRRATPHH
jgi:tRNA(Arg) A34 adenosine deaminase TadA